LGREKEEEKKKKRKRFILPIYLKGGKIRKNRSNFSPEGKKREGNKAAIAAIGGRKGGKEGEKGYYSKKKEERKEHLPQGEGGEQ